MADTIDPKYKQPNPPNQQQRPLQGTGFTNIQRILGANQGNRLGSTIQGGVSGVAQQARTNIQQASNKFNQDVEANRLGTASQQADVAGTIENPTAAVGDTDTAKQIRERFLKYRTGAYSGPQQLQNADALRGQAADASQLGRLATTVGGRQGLLQRFVGSPSYSGGEQRLDSLLLGQQGQGALRGIRRDTAGLENQATQAAQTAQSVGQGAVEQARGFAKNVLDQLSTSENKIIGQDTDADFNTIRGRLAAAKKASSTLKSDYETLNNLLAGQIKVGDLPGTENLSEADRNVIISNKGIGLLKALDLASRRGYINPQDFQTITQAAANAPSGFDVNQIIKNTLTQQLAQNETEAGVATPEQLAKVNALAMLSGAENIYDPNSGRYQAGSLAFNAANIRQAVEDELKRRNQQYKTDFGKATPSQLDTIKKFLSPEAVGATFSSGIKDINPFYSPSDAAMAAAKVGALGLTAPTQIGGSAVTGTVDNTMSGINNLSQGNIVPGAIQTMYAAPLAVGDTAARTGQVASGLAGELGQAQANLGQQIDQHTGLSDLDARLGGLGLLSSSGAFSAPTSIASGALSEGGGQFFSGLGGTLSGLGQGNIGGALSSFGQSVVAPFQAARAAAEAAKRIPVIGGIFCFAENTPVLMKDGRYKYIQDLDLYDETAQGGRVVVSGKAISEEMYDYKGVHVTGSHSVFEDGVWVRVKDSKHGINLNITEPVTIYTVSNIEHVLLIKDVVFADYSETDLGTSISDEERLNMLNGNSERNANLLKIEKGLKEHYAYIKGLQSEGTLQNPSIVVGSI